MTQYKENIFTSLEILSSVRDQSESQESKNSNIFSAEVPELQVFHKISKFSINDFKFKWNLILFLTNTYNLFTSIYCLAFSTFPSEFWLEFELLFEGILLVDYLIRLYKSRLKQQGLFYLVPDRMTFLNFCIYSLSSVPYTAIYVLSQRLDLNSLEYLRLLKILRVFSIYQSFTEFHLLFPQSSIISVFQYTYLIFFTQHYSAMFYLLWLKSSNFYKSASHPTLYLQSYYWAAETLTGLVLTPTTGNDSKGRVLGIFIMIIGMLLYGLVFIMISKYLRQKYSGRAKRSYEKRAIFLWTQQRNLPSDLKDRIEAYTLITQESKIQDIFLKFPEEIPLSLKTELNIFRFKSLIQKVKLFELSEPSFVLSVLRCLDEKIFLPEDFVLRFGDIADCMFFVMLGQVEVIGQDLTKLAILGEGEYFGEIGILMNRNRTVHVKAIDTCIMARIMKNEMLEILENFLEYKKLLVSVAEERLRTCCKEDVEAEHDLVEDDCGSSDSDKSGELECPQYYSTSEHVFKSWILKMITVPQSKSQKGMLLIDPLSNFYNMWVMILVLSFSYCLFEIPFTIAFGTRPGFVIIDLVVFILFVFDLIISYKSSYITKYKKYVHSKEERKKAYFDKYFIVDLLSVVPIDWAYYSYQSSSPIISYFRTLRFFKIFRLASLIKSIQEHSSISERTGQLLFHIYTFLSITHLSACILSNFSSEPSYISCLYWSVSIFSQSSYGDISPSLSGQLISLLLINLSKLLFILLYVESALFILEKNHFQLEFLKKIKNTQEWMNHCKLAKPLQSSINEYFLAKWEKIYGLDDQTVISMLPESLTTDLRLFLFRGIVNSELFPQDDTGAILAIIKKCRIVLVNQGLNVFTQGEIGLEMFFILEGKAAVINSDLTELVELATGSFFGELALINEHPMRRSASVLAKSHLTLAALSMIDFKEVVSLFKDFGRKVMVIAEERNRTMRKNGDFEFRCLNESDGKGLSFFMMNDTSMDKTHVLTTLTARDQEQEIRYKPFVFKVKENNMKDCVYFIVWLWNVIFIPLQAAFKIEYFAPFYLMECVSVIFYIIVAIYYVLLMRFNVTIENNKTRKIENMARIVANMILSIPFSLIFFLSGFDGPLGLRIAFSYLRISNFPFIYYFFSRLKKKFIFWYVGIEGCKIFVVSIAMSHVAACLFVTLGKDEPKSWISNRKLDYDLDIYLNAFYWSMGTLTHVTQGDVVSVTDSEKYFSVLYSGLSFFVFIVFFGELASLITIYRSSLRHLMFKDYSYTIKFLKNKNIEKQSQQINNYFDFIWKHHKGILEKKLIPILPFSLQCEIFIAKYSNILINSQILSDDGILNESLVRSLSRFMQFNYYLLGDVIVRIEDSNQNFYFILDGEVNIISFQGDSVICVLGPGNYFGEASILYNTPFRTASVVAVRFTHTFVIKDRDIQIIFSAFPEWKTKLGFIAKERLKNNFGIVESDLKTEFSLKMNENIQIDHNEKNLLSKKTELLIMKKVAEAKEISTVSEKSTVDLIHFSLIIYSCYILPVMVVFYTLPPVWMIIIELLYIFESSIFICIEISKIWQRDLSFLQNLINLLKSRFMLIDLISTFPLNLIITLSNSSSFNFRFIRSIRLNRLLSCLRVHTYLTDFSIKFKSLHKYLSIIEELLIVSLFVHWSACIFHLYNDCSSYNSYSDALYLILNFVSTTGHTDGHPCKPAFMILVVLIGSISTLALAILHSALSIIFHFKEPSPSELFATTIKRFSVFYQSQVPKMIKSRFEDFAKFNSCLQYYYGETIIKEIYKHVPNNMVHNLIYEKFRKKLKKVPFLKDQQQPIMLKRFALSLKPEIYLPGDYLIYKDDIGHEMYFIDIGVVDIISPDNTKTIKSLRKGDFVGEMALINNSNRICSVVARTLCLVYVLTKHDFYSILSTFPDVLTSIKKYSEIRSRETTSLAKENLLSLNGDLQKKRLLNHLTMYANMASSFAVITKNQTKFSLITGMKHLQSDIDLVSFAPASLNRSGLRRRPAKHEVEDIKDKRRKSQKSIGGLIVQGG